jgi:hypothetical protein
MGTRFIIAFLFCFALGKAQTITFNGCQALFENQDYTFNPDGIDGTGRNIYTTTPVTGDQPCGGVGTCEFKIKWNATLSRWEFIADAGAGDFTETFTIYYNTSASVPNPPSVTLGSWVENTVMTQSVCGGSLSAGNSELTGSVQNTLLNTPGFERGTLTVFPNPVTEMLTIKLDDLTEGNISIFNNLGQMIIAQPMSENTINVSGLQNGIYYIRLDSDNGSYVSKFIKQ